MGLRALARLAANDDCDDDEAVARPVARAPLAVVAPVTAPVADDASASAFGASLPAEFQGWLDSFPHMRVVPVRERAWTAAEDERARRDMVRRWARECPEVYASRVANRDDWGAIADLFSPEIGGQMDLEVTTRRLSENGWPWYAQKRTGRQRTPALVRKGEMSVKLIGAAGTTPHQAVQWLGRARAKREHYPNVAIVAGPASGCFFWDSDVNDAERAAVVRRITNEVLGPTPFERSRLHTNRIARIYRFPADHDWKTSLPGELSWMFDEEVAAESDPSVVVNVKGLKRDAIEILGAGKSLTIHGRHHADGYPFLWSDLLPGMDAGALPSLATEVTVDQVRECMRRIALEAPGRLVKRVKATSTASGGATDTVAVDVSGMLAPSVRKYKDGIVIREGRVVDGREAYVWELTRKLVWINRTLPLGADESSLEAECEQFVEKLVATCLEHLEQNDKWDEAHIRTLAEEKLPRVLENKRETVKAGLATPREGVAVTRGSDVIAAPVPAAVQTIDADITALVAAHVRLELPVSEVSEDAKAARALLTVDERKSQAQRVAAQTRDPIVRWLDAVWDVQRGQRRVSAKEMAELQTAAMRVVLLLGPTGSGKTSTLLKAVHEQIQRRGRIGPLLFMAPSYSLLEDVIGRSKELSDAAEQVATEVAAREAEAMGLRVMMYQGKGKLCLREEGRILAAARMSLAHLCESTERERIGDGPDATWKTVPVICQFKEDGSCPAWAQLTQILTADIVFLPTAFVSLPVPAELKSCVALVVDESVAGRFLRTDSLAVSSLRLPRREPSLSKRDVQAGLDADSMVQVRLEANAIISSAAERLMRDPNAPEIAEALLDADWYVAPPRDGEEAKPVDPIEQMETAKNVVGRAADMHRHISPTLSVYGAQQLAMRPTATDLWGEYHLHAVLIDRMEALRHDRQMAGLHAAALLTNPDCPAPARTARGRSDARVQVLREEAEDGTTSLRIRVSWRAKNSFGHLPTLLMDASASEDMVEKLWNGREVTACHAPARMHLRVVAVCDQSYSDSSMQPWRHKAEVMRQAAASRCHDVRGVVDVLAGMYDQVVVASTKGVEVSMHTAWVPPANASWLHYGACVGLDFAKAYPAVVIVGRQELPHGAIDAVVGALTYDDHEPEAPIDLYGTGLDRDGESIRTPTVERAILMRAGHDVTVNVPVHTGKWARIVQAQAREEQLRQAIGRLRPVYRDGEAPLVVVLGSCLPEDLVVDVVCGMSDLRVAGGLYARAREGGGVLTAELTRRGAALSHAYPTTGVLDPAWTDMSKRHCAGFVRCAYTRDDGTDHEVDVLAYEDPMQAIARFEQANGREWIHMRGYREIARGRPMSQLKPREPDAKMVALVGDREEQAAAEQRLMDAVRSVKLPARLGRDGQALKGRSGLDESLSYAEAQVLLALSTRPVAGANVNAAPVVAEPVIEEPEPEVEVLEAPEAANEVAPRTLGEALFPDDDLSALFAAA